MFQNILECGVGGNDSLSRMGETSSHLLAKLNGHIIFYFLSIWHFSLFHCFEIFQVSRTPLPPKFSLFYFSGFFFVDSFPLSPPPLFFISTIYFFFFNFFFFVFHHLFLESWCSVSNPLFSYSIYFSQLSSCQWQKFKNNLGFFPFPQPPIPQHSAQS